MSLRADCCLDEIAESYCMGALDAGERAAYEKHLLVCGEWRGIVEATEAYVRAIREMARL